MFAEIIGEAHEAMRAAGVQPYLEIGSQKQGAGRGSRGHSALAGPGPEPQDGFKPPGLLNDTLSSYPFQQPLSLH